MPAVTAETLTLPRLPHPDPGQVNRPIASVITAPSGSRARDSRCAAPSPTWIFEP
jgi:hypothetical protein